MQWHKTHSKVLSRKRQRISTIWGREVNESAHDERFLEEDLNTSRNACTHSGCCDAAVKLPYRK